MPLAYTISYVGLYLHIHSQLHLQSIPCSSSSPALHTSEICSVIYIMPCHFCFLLQMMYVKRITHHPLPQSDYWLSWPFPLPSMSHPIKMNSTVFSMIRNTVRL